MGEKKRGTQNDGAVDLMDLPDLLGIEQVRHWDDNKEQKIEK
jgi:hypothetical protein